VFQTPLRLATSIAEPTSTTSQTFPEISVKKESLSPKKPLSNAPIAIVKQEDNTPSNSPLLVIKLREKNASGISERRSERGIGSARDESAGEKETKVQPLLTIDLPLSLADNTNDRLAIQEGEEEEEEAMEETEGDEDEDGDGSLYIKQEESMSSDPIATFVTQC
jgi:hypothetical protein